MKYRIVPGSPCYNMYPALEVWEFGLKLDEKVGPRGYDAKAAELFGGHAALNFKPVWQQLWARPPVL